MASAKNTTKKTQKIDILRSRERVLWKEGVPFVAGVDEAGIGPLAGPVVAAAVVLPKDFDASRVNDSKKMTERKREALYPQILEEAVTYCIVAVEPSEIDELNIYHAGLTAMRRALEGLQPTPGHALIDGRKVPGLACEQTRIVGGDAVEASIAAASILAKVHRDRAMVEMDTLYPGYSFAKHKGYPTPVHQRALADLGPCPIHRRSFPALNQFCGFTSELFDRFAASLATIRTIEALKAWRKSLSEAKSELEIHELKRLRSLAQKTKTLLSKT